MLRAHWSGFEIDSSEAAYSIKVEKPEELGTLVRAMLGSGYFVRSFKSTFDPSLERLRDYVKAHEPADAPVLKTLEDVLGKAKENRPTNIGVRAIEPILNYVGAHAKDLQAAKTFRFEPTEEDKEAWADSEIEFKAGQKVKEDDFYSEYEIPMDGVVLNLACQLVGLNKLSPEEQEEAREAIRATDVMIQEEEDEEDEEDWDSEEEDEEEGADEIQSFQEMLKQMTPENRVDFEQVLTKYDLTMTNLENVFRLLGDMRQMAEEAQEKPADDLLGEWGDDRSYWDTYDHPQDLSLRVRLEPRGKFSIHGRWMDDGQFAYGYYQYVLERVAEKVGAKISMGSL